MELTGPKKGIGSSMASFSLLLAELMIGTNEEVVVSVTIDVFQSPISGVNDWNMEYGTL